LLAIFVFVTFYVLFPTQPVNQIQTASRDDGFYDLSPGDTFLRSIEETKDLLENHTAYINCFDNPQSTNDCEAVGPIQPLEADTTLMTSIQVDDFKRFSSTPNFILGIFFVLLVQLASLFAKIQFFLLNIAASVFLNRMHVFTVNTAPFLGMLGTVYSFGLVASNSSGSQLSTLFRLGFIDAILTTVFGGMIFVLAMFLSAVRDEG
tara:strand:+ start:9998 stop:10615 length:618 start_codon:yes stop_codon:yes gene_type:complete